MKTCIAKVNKIERINFSPYCYITRLKHDILTILKCNELSHSKLKIGFTNFLKLKKKVQ